MGTDGKYYVAGSAGTGPNLSLSVARVTSSGGTLDGTFGVSGVASVNDGSDPGRLTVTAGAFVYVFGTAPTIARMTSTGAVDPSYGAGGVLSGFTPPGQFSVGGLLGGGVQPSGKAVVVTSSTEPADLFKTPLAIRANAVTSAPAGSFLPLIPARVLDTRTGNGAPKAAVAPGGSLSLQVGGRGGVPAIGVGAGVAAVTMTVAAVSPTRSGFVTVYPSGTARPNVSNLNHPAGATT